ncbi:N-acetylmuramoyl-L-alanine amidase [Frankia sp. AvcI1]|uniref:N-acetylmuramoyl-L-alanine amidase n=1 Tax=Frankia sp. AvcI1 TaxID=573496 RepID=UPI002118545D|nr:N-acetylmuramoyl-L-alanine amidase [Frankia sp. AvcI1]
MLTCYQHDGDIRTVLARLVPSAGPAEMLRAATAIPAGAQWHPDAVREPLTQDMGGVLTYSRGLVLHVQAGNNDPVGWFGRADVQASSHWWVSKTGRLIQYVPAGRVAWAQAGGNSSWHSVETEGLPDEALTGAQLATLAVLYRWGRVWWGWPLTLAESPTGSGLGWHGMGGTPWGGHFDCPGETRKGQRAAILALVQTTPTPTPPEEDDVPLTDADADKVAKATISRLQSLVWDDPHPPNQPHVGALIRRTYEMTGDTLGRVTAIQTASATPAARTASEPPPVTVDDVLAGIAATTDNRPLLDILRAVTARLAELAAPSTSAPTGGTPA